MNKFLFVLGLVAVCSLGCSSSNGGAPDVVDGFAGAVEGVGGGTSGGGENTAGSAGTDDQQTAGTADPGQEDEICGDKALGVIEDGIAEYASYENVPDGITVALFRNGSEIIVTDSSTGCSLHGLLLDHANEATPEDNLNLVMKCWHGDSGSFQDMHGICTGDWSPVCGKVSEAPVGPTVLTESYYDEGIQSEVVIQHFSPVAGELVRNHIAAGETNRSVYETSCPITSSVNDTVNVMYFETDGLYSFAVLSR